MTTVAALPLLLLLSGSGHQRPAWPQTRAEKTAFQETSHYADVIAFLDGLGRMGAAIRVEIIGKSHEGRPIPLVVAHRDPGITPEAARRSNIPIVYIQGNIHAGEVEGKEAALHVLRRWCQEASTLSGKTGGAILDRVVILMVPIYNIDGNERFGPAERNRPGQVGPAQVGLRPNGQGLDLNRDCMKAESPEMRSLLKHVYNGWDPDVVMDLHTTNGTRHGYELTYSPPLNPNTDPRVLKYARDELLPSIRRRLRQEHGAELFDYGNAETRDGRRAWFTFGQEGRYVTNYAGLRNRIGVLSEAMNVLSFKERVAATERFTEAVVEQIASNGRGVLAITRGADQRLMRGLVKELGVRFDYFAGRTEDVLLEPAPPQGQRRPAGRPTRIERIRMPVFDRFTVTKWAKVPTGYFIEPAETATVELLRRHGILVERTKDIWTGDADRFDIAEVAVAPQPFQGHRLVRLEGTFSRERLSVGRDSFLVRTAQPLGTLAFHLLEPESLDGAAAWGFIALDRLEKKEYPVLKAFGAVRLASERAP